jgi:hypothetical protein
MARPTLGDAAKLEIGGISTLEYPQFDRLSRSD